MGAGAKDFLNLVVEKLRELWLAVENFWGQILGWFHKPESRSELSHWLHVALLILIVLVLTCTLYYFCKCFCRCCCGGRRGGYKMMKAPGRNCRMPRHEFEENPRSYFQKLRAYPGDELC